MSLVNRNLPDLIKAVLYMECGGMLSASIMLVSLKLGHFKIENIDIIGAIFLGLLALGIAVSI